MQEVEAILRGIHVLKWKSIYLPRTALLSVCGSGLQPVRFETCLDDTSCIACFASTTHPGHATPGSSYKMRAVLFLYPARCKTGSRHTMGPLSIIEGASLRTQTQGGHSLPQADQAGFHFREASPRFLARSGRRRAKVARNTFFFDGPARQKSWLVRVAVFSGGHWVFVRTLSRDHTRALDS